MPQIEVTFDIDANGIVKVSAKDLGTGKQQQITISGSTALSDDEVDRMVKDAEAHAEEDKRQKDEVEARNQTDSLVYSTEQTLSELGDKVPADVKDEAQKAIDKAKAALDGTDIDAIRGAGEELRSVGYKLAEVVHYRRPATGDRPVPQARCGRVHAGRRRRRRRLRARRRERRTRKGSNRPRPSRAHPVTGARAQERWQEHAHRGHARGGPGIPASANQADTGTGSSAPSSEPGATAAAADRGRPRAATPTASSQRPRRPSKASRWRRSPRTASRRLPRRPRPRSGRTSSCGCTPNGTRTAAARRSSARPRRPARPRSWCRACFPCWTTSSGTIDYATKNGEQGLLDGVSAVHTKMVDVLKKDGVEVIDPQGEAFDALEAQAVATVDDANVPDETVAEVYQKGYKMGCGSLATSHGDRDQRWSEAREGARLRADEGTK